MVKLKRRKDRAGPWSWCPVNKKCPSKLTKVSFRKMCLNFQDRAVNKRNQFTNGVTGWNDARFKICVNCRTGKNVKEGKEITPPLNIEFVELPKPKPKLKRRVK